jgi:nitrous oxidase accessory protein NosD
MTSHRFFVAAGILAVAAMASSARAEQIDVAPGASVQDALDAASDGDEIVLAAGRYEGDLDFLGKAVVVRGAGDDTVLVGTGSGPVVRFANGEGDRSVLDSVRVTGGQAVQGGGIYISGASPVIVRCVITRNRASAQGSGIHVTGGSRALILNNLVTYNRRDGTGDPHGIEVVGAAPLIAYNTIARGDSNGIILRGDSASVVAGNVIAWNGARVRGKLRGRGICDFSGGRATIVANVFHRNRIAALLRDGRDFRKIKTLQKAGGDARVRDNVDGSPGVRRSPPKRARLSRAKHFRLRRRGKAVDGGVDAAVCPDLDGTRADAGFTGGPFAEGGATPTASDACVLGLLSL